MSALTSKTPAPEFKNVQVTAIPSVDGNGNTKYETTFDPPSLHIKTHDAVINYQIVDPTPSGVRFKSVSVSPDHMNQLSPSSISESGKMVTFSDANTITAKLDVTFHFSDADGTDFLVDPDIDNTPPPEL